MAKWKLGRALLLCLPCAALFADEQTSPSVDQILGLPVQTLNQNQQTQREVDQLADETRELVSEYRLKLQELDRVQRYNANLARTIADQQREMASLEHQIAHFGDFERGIVPLMMDMVDELAEFIRLDVPFLLDQRQERVNELRGMLDRADVSVSEKYRQIMQAYLGEAVIGRNIEAYSGQIDTGDGEMRIVDFFRLGRTVLVYQTPDREITGYWDTSRGEWQQLPASYGASINLGLRIARRQAAPELLTLPVPLPTRVESP